MLQEILLKKEFLLVWGATGFSVLFDFTVLDWFVFSFFLMFLMRKYTYMHNFSYKEWELSHLPFLLDIVK